MTNLVKETFLVNRDETGRELYFFPETGKKYFVEYIQPRGFKTTWGDVNPATKKVEGSYGDKFTGSVSSEESVITVENGFEDIVEGIGSVASKIEELHNKWKKENGYA